MRQDKTADFIECFEDLRTVINPWVLRIANHLILTNRGCISG
jgi:hypothetical protein